MKKPYSGLTTTRVAVEGQPFMDGQSNTKIRVRTIETTNAGWKAGQPGEEEDLATSIDMSTLE